MLKKWFHGINNMKKILNNIWKKIQPNIMTITNGSNQKKKQLKKEKNTNKNLVTLDSMLIIQILEL